MAFKTVLCTLLATALVPELALGFTVAPIRTSVRMAPADKLSLQPQRKSVHIQATAAINQNEAKSDLPAWKASVSKILMQAYIAAMCISLPLTLFPQKLLHRLGIIDKKRKEHFAVQTGCFCSRWMLRLLPFCNLKTIPSGESLKEEPEPAVWVCNHTSMLDIFILLAADKRLRGRKKRPIKIIYWKQLEDNPITKLLFRQAGFISIDMEDNGSGNANEYNKSTFKALLKDCKLAFSQGFDIGLLPEGQLNPHPENGLLPIFSGAYTLAKMSRRPIKMMALSGLHRLWHPNESIGMTVTSRDVKVRCYPHGRIYTDADDFKETFTTVVGQFGATGEDLEATQLEEWLTGAKWKR